MSSYIVYRPSLGEIIVTNVKLDEDIIPTQEEIDAWYAPKPQPEQPAE